MPNLRTPTRAATAFALGVALSVGAFVAFADSPSKPAYAADPPPHATQRHWVFNLAVQQGTASINKVSPLVLAKPAESARRTGRFALELYIGNELLDRVRFNVPLMGDEPPIHSKRRPFRAPSLDKVTTHVSAQIADHPRATYLRLVDRITGQTQRFEWPPEPDGRLLPWRAAAVADAGPSDFPEGGTRVVTRKDLMDAGAPEGGNERPSTPEDAGRD